MRRGNYKFFSKYSWYLPGVGGMFGMLALLLLGALLGGIAMMILMAVMGQEAGTMYGQLVSYPIMFIPPMIYAANKSNTLSMNNGGRKLDSNNFSPLGTLVCVLLAIVSTLAVGFWAEPITSLLPEMPAALEETLKGLTTGNFFFNFLAVSIFAPFFEEWLCRGIVLRGLLCKAKIKPVWAIIISAIFFALIHMNPWQAIPAFLMGCLFGYVYWRTGSLKLTMLMHFTNNTFALICGHIDALKDADGWFEVIPSPLYGIVVAAMVIVSALAVLAFSKIKLNTPEGNMDKVSSIFDSNEA